MPQKDPGPCYNGTIGRQEMVTARADPGHFLFAKYKRLFTIIIGHNC